MHNRFFSTVFGVLVIGVLFVACELTKAQQDLRTAIEDATELYEDSKEGTASGEYPVGSRKNLKDAIDFAQAVLDITPDDYAELEESLRESGLVGEDFKVDDAYYEQTCVNAKTTLTLAVENFEKLQIK